MKVACIASRHSGTMAEVEQMKKIASKVKSLGYSTDISMLERTLEEEHQDLEGTYKNHLKSIKNADVIIAEVTAYSAGIGFIIASALNERKQVLCLHNKSSDRIPSATLKGASSSNLLEFSEYNDESIDDKLKSYLEDVKGKLDTKFILIISPEIDKYLKWSADARRMHKAQVVREAIDKMMQKDKSYKDHLQNLG